MIIQVGGRNHSLEVVGMKSTFLCWLSAGVHSLLLEAAYISSHAAHSIFKAAMTEFFSHL